jgi:cysteine desulfurase
MNHIYLDYNATTPVDARVLDAMLPFYRDDYGNPSSSHRLGRRAQEAVQRARAQLAELIGAESDEIVFTSGGTESSNLAIQGHLLQRAPDGNGHLVISSIEHPATVQPAHWLQRWGYQLSVVGCDSAGVVNPADVASAIRDETILVSIMHANNEVGSIQPIAEIAAVCRDAGVALHVDAAQSAGKITVDVKQLGADLLTLAGHKFYASKGVGALYVRRGVKLEPVLRGAGQERGLRPGTENVAQIVGLGAAAELATRELPAADKQLAGLRDRLQQELAEAAGSRLTVHAATAKRLPNTLSVSFPGVSGAELLDQIPQLCASTGAACHSGTTKMSATLAAMGVSEERARGTIRLSVGRFSTEQDIDATVRLLIDAWRQSS